MRPIDADYLNMYLCELQMANLGADDDYCETLNEVIHIVDEQPTIEAAPVKHGQIIETIEKGKMKRVFSCCNTDCTQLTMWMNPVFCPNCGAKMDGDTNA